MRGIIYVGLAGIITLENLFYAIPQNAHALNYSNPDALTKTAQIEEKMKKTKVKITTKEVKSKDNILEVDLDIPVIEGLDNEKIQENINKQFEIEIMQFKNQIEKNAKKDYEEFKKQGWKFRPYIVHTEYEISYNKNDIISVSIIYWQYTGGAHGNYIKKSYNINLKTGEEISLKDIFKENTKYKDIITNEIKRKMESEPEKYFQDAIKEFKTISDNQPFYIKNGAIVVYFQTYEIAPYASGIPEFKIPFSLFKAHSNE